MKSFRISCRICQQNIRKWTSNPRIWMSLLISIIFVYSYTKGLRIASMTVHEPMSPWIFPFLCTRRYMKFMFMAPILFIFCDAPFIDSNQAYVMLRTKRSIWSAGQVLYIMAGSFLYILLLFVSSIVCQLGYLTWDTDWGKLLGMAGTTTLLKELNQGTVTVAVSSEIVEYFSVVQAILFTALLLWLSMVLLGLIIYVCNVLTKTKLVGVAISGFLVLFTAIAEALPKLTRFSPISWNSLNNIAIGSLSQKPGIVYILTIYIVLDVILVVAVVALGRKQEIEIQQVV